MPSLFGEPAWATSLGTLVLAAIAGLIVHRIAFRMLRVVARRTGTGWDDALIDRLRPPSRMFFPLVAIMIVVSSLELGPGLAEFVRHVLSLGLIACIAWLSSAIVYAGKDAVLSRHKIETEDNLRARAIHTQVRVLTRVLFFVIFVVAAAAALMTFEKVRSVGVSMLASAGIVGIVMGFAAQTSIATLIAGIQIAITQPIRIDDVVIVEGEWGRIEEITLTYVVVRIWDQRRLVVPITYFIENTFQNWTRVSADILGTVYLYADYRVPIEEVRKKVTEISAASPHWDGRVAGLVVTNATERTLELRALISAADSGKAWDLRCELREKLLVWLQETHPDSLPRLRAEMEGDRPQSAAAGTVPGRHA